MLVRRGTHPLPDSETVQNSEKLIEHALGSSENDHVIFLISGGASSMFAVPHETATLAEKREVTGTLMSRGANISELNCVRRHISGIKGGRFASMVYPRKVCTFMISDVPTGIPEDIGSGPTLPDRTTCSDALAVLRKYRTTVRLGRKVRSRLEDRRLETLKPEDRRISRSSAFTIAANRDAVMRLCSFCREQGLTAFVSRYTLSGGAEQAAKLLIAEGRRRLHGKGVIAAGGEITTKASAGARGGRCQHFALICSGMLHRDEIVVAFGTDGKDGNSDFAGAVGFSGLRGCREGPNDFEGEKCHRTMGTGLLTGKTGTNVSDIYLYCRL